MVKIILVPIEFDGWLRQERDESRRNAAGACRWTAASVRGGKSLVQVEVAQVKTGIARPGNA